MAPNLGNSSSPVEFSFRTRRRLWDFLRNNPTLSHNVLVVGGGIVGAGLLRQLVYSGIKDVLLVEKGDFASGTSSVSSKLIHAGLRYLEQVWLHLKGGRLISAWRSFIYVFGASWERKILGRMAPGLITPKPFQLVLAQDDQRSPFSVAAGVWLYYLIQTLQGQFFPPPRLIFRSGSIRKLFPDLNADRVKAVFEFWDSETDDARLVMENIQSAFDRGGMALNYVELLSFRVEPKFVAARLKNVENGEEITVKAKALINSTGPWLDEFRKREEPKTEIFPWLDRVAGAHVDVSPALSENSYYITAPDGRLVFLLRRDEDGLLYTRIGTTERPLTFVDATDNIHPSPVEIDYLLDVARRYLKSERTHSFEIVRSDEGIRPLYRQEGGVSFHKSREHAIVIDNRILHLIGVKLTDFRKVAAEVMREANWDLWGISVENFTGLTASLRSAGEKRMYREQSIEEFVQRTMILHWADYVRRRRGLYPRWQQQAKPELFRQDFEALSRAMRWEPEVSFQEWRSEKK